MLNSITSFRHLEAGWVVPTAHLNLFDETEVDPLSGPPRISPNSQIHLDINPASTCGVSIFRSLSTGAVHVVKEYFLGNERERNSSFEQQK